MISIELGLLIHMERLKQAEQARMARKAAKSQHRHRLSWRSLSRLTKNVLRVARPRRIFVGHMPRRAPF